MHLIALSSFWGELYPCDFQIFARRMHIGVEETGGDE